MNRTRVPHNDHTTIQDLNLTTPPIEGTTKGASAAAYTNNDLNGATATTLFDINTAGDQVVIQSPANNGTLAPTGSLGIDAQINAGMDIFSTLSDGKTVSNAAFATLTASGANRPRQLSPSRRSLTRSARLLPGRGEHETWSFGHTCRGRS